MSDQKKILFVEPKGDFIRLDRCMQSIDSWGGVYRFPLNMARIAAHLMPFEHMISFVDLQADKSADLKKIINSFQPDVCILSSGFPSMYHDADAAQQIRKINPDIHISTFGVAPTLLKSDFFNSSTWGFNVPFDSIVTGGEPAVGYQQLLNEIHLKGNIINSSMPKFKDIETFRARPLFNNSFYRSPFTGEPATYIEGTYGCPYRCSFCVVPELYEGHFSKRTAKDIIEEFRYVIEEENIQHITLWDEGTTFQKSFFEELCEGLTELKSNNKNQYQNFKWTTRSTTALLDRSMVKKLAASGLSGITLGIESFDSDILRDIEKEISLEANQNAIKWLNEASITSIGHVILGHLNENRRSIENTLNAACSSSLSFAQFYCAVPYPRTKLHVVAQANNLIRIHDLTKYELCNPIMDTLGGLSYSEIGGYRKRAIKKFWSRERLANLSRITNQGSVATRYFENPTEMWQSNLAVSEYEPILDY